MKVKRYALSVDDIQELIDRSKSDKIVIEDAKDGYGNSYLKAIGNCIFRTYDFADELEID